RVTPGERRAPEAPALASGARRVYVLEEAMAAAIGAGLPVHDATASLVVDVGGGTTEVAVISLGGIVNARSLRVGGDEVDEAIVTGVRSAHELLLGERSTQEIKLTIGSAYPLTEELEMRVRGRDVGTGLPRTVRLNSTEVRRMIEPALLQIGDVVTAVLDVWPPQRGGERAGHGGTGLSRTVRLNSTEVRRMIEPALLQIVDVVKAVLDVCPPELAGDVLDHGVVLTGGGAQLRGFEERLHRELGVPVRVADDPARAVIRGAGACVDDFAALEPVLVSPRRR